MLNNNIIKFIFFLLTGQQILLAQLNNKINIRQLSGIGNSPQSITYGIKQDSIGNLWIASEEGVLKFDSKKFKLYNTYKGLPKKVSNKVTELFIDSKQRIWIGLEKSICIYNNKFDRFDLINTNEDINPEHVYTITEDNKHQIWFGTYNGLWVIDDKMQFKHFLPKKNIFSILSHNDNILFGASDGFFAFKVSTQELRKINLNDDTAIRCIVRINNQIFAGSKSGEIYKISNKQFTVKQLNINPKITKPIFDIIADDQNNYYVGTNGDGFYKLDSNFKLLEHIVEDPDIPNTIRSNSIYDMEKGHENIIWLATYGGGVNYFNPQASPFKIIRHQINNSNSLITNFTRAIEKDKNGKIWFGTKKGISIFDPVHNTWRHLSLKTEQNNLENSIVLSLEPDGNYMWVSTYNNGLFKIDVNNYQQWNDEKLRIPKQKQAKIYSLLKDNKANLWMGGIANNLYVFRKDKTEETYPIINVRTLTETKNGSIIAGCMNGIYIINDSINQYKHIKNLLPDKTMAYPKINCIYETNDGQLVIGTNGAGLIFYDPKTQIKKVINLTKSLPSDIVKGILATNDQNLWVSTIKGLAHIIIKPKDTLIYVYDKTDGLASTEYIMGSYCKISDSLFAFGGIDGASLFNPYNIKVKEIVPKVIFDELKVSNKIIKLGEKPLKFHIDATSEINLKYKQNSIELKFTGVLQDNPSQVKYSWILEGFEQNWTTPSYTNFATYTNLNAGDYTFKVKAFNKYGKSSPVREIKIHVQAPWWASNIAYFIYGVLIIGLFFAVIRITSLIVNKKYADTQIDFFNNLTHEIRTPMAILLSSLNSISSEPDLDKTSNLRIKNNVNQINALFEQMLNFQRFTSSKHFNEDIHKININTFIKDLLSNFNPVVKERNLHIEINNQWGDKSFYFNKEYLEKILLNLISNAVKYSFDNGKITINIRKTGKNDLKIDVIDEGLGIPKDQQKYILNRYYRAQNAINSQRPGTGLGLIMVKKLLDKTGGNIKFESQENKGTKFTLLIKNFAHKYNEKAIIKSDHIHKNKYDFEDLSELSNYSDTKILIVEDNNELRRTLVKELSYYFQVFEAKNGKEGLEKANQINPDIILTDLIMPEIDGMEMAKIIKNDINLNHIPIFMISVIHDSDQKLKSAETGISYYFEKPVDIKYLMSKILSILKLKENLRKKYIHENNIDNAALYRNKNDQEFLNKLEKIILDNIENSDFSVHDLSEKMGMSRTSLYMKLKNMVNLSPQDFIVQAKLRLAKKLLIKGEMSIKEVAYSSGFSNPKYFSTVFKKFNQKSPRQFIDSLKKDNPKK